LRNRDRILDKQRDYYRKNKIEINKRRREHYKKNREKILARCRELYRNDKQSIQTQKKNNQRAHKLSTKSGKVIHSCKKRPYPSDGKCEICGKQTRLVYHHWKIIENIIYGIWICQGTYSCHNFVELYEKGLLDKYLKLKTIIDEEF